MKPLEQHQTEIQGNLQVWHKKPLLHDIYASVYSRVIALINRSAPEPVVEIGSGIGNLKTFLPGTISTDLFPNPWLDMVCDGYELPFRDASVSHLILSDVFHHLQAPNAFLREARRVLTKKGRVILSDPYVSVSSYPIYGMLHHEPMANSDAIDFTESFPRPRNYYAAQGNSTRLFFSDEFAGWPNGWNVFHREAYAAFSYFLSGGYSKPAFYPRSCLGAIQAIDRKLSRWPKLFGARCIVGLTPV